MIEKQQDDYLSQFQIKTRLDKVAFEKDGKQVVKICDPSAAEATGPHAQELLQEKEKEPNVRVSDEDS